MLPDPYTCSEGWKDDVSLMPDVNWPDVYNYLINTPSSFTNESLKAYKSLESYNFFICGHVQEVYYNHIEKNAEFCFIKSEVRYHTLVDLSLVISNLFLYIEKVTVS